MSYSNSEEVTNEVLKKDKMKSIADELLALESNKNEGRGIQSVKTLVTFLNKGNFEAACAVAQNEWDKISSYCDISSLLIKHKIFVPLKFN